jgi:thioredoxin 1
MSNILYVQKDDWQKVETSAKPALVDFWAEWCAPCRAFGPTFDRLAEKYASEVLFAKVNVDEVPELAERYGIRSIPTVLLLREGNVVERFVGARTYQDLAQVLERQATVAVRK